jgi:hypothetical protein
MAKHHVAVFRRYEFAPGQKIRIEDGPHGGDWLVLSADEKTVRVRCPVSGRELQWPRLCYLVEETEQEWPAED